MYYKRFINLVEIAEVQWGLITPEGLAALDPNYNREAKKGAVRKEARNRFLACVFK